ncbi:MULTISPECIES: hypothetical protein [unclassified Streptomyces]|uniref:hypothetical protein n=1 Tax=unclassified Streptomyces TaxID=2593676 RepID=UPI003249E701
MTISRMCPTCRSRQDFRQLNDAEKGAVREEKGDRHYVHDLWRCTADRCLTYFRYGNMSDRGLLPEKFRKEPAAPE